MPIVHTDDGPIEVDYDAIELKDNERPNDLPGVQDELNRIDSKVRAEVKSSLPNQLKTDDEFFEEAARVRGYEFREDGQLKNSTRDDELKKLRKEKAKLEQRAQKADELEKQIEAARETRLENQLLQHADGVEDDLKDLFLSDAKSRFLYDEEDDSFVPVKGDGTPDYAASTEDVINALRESRPSLFKRRAANDGPTDRPTDAVRSGQITSKADLETPRAKSEYIAEHGQEAYLDLPRR
jgi:hypothetical protein